MTFNAYEKSYKQEEASKSEEKQEATSEPEEKQEEASKSTPEGYTCPVCKRYFKTKWGLNRHILTFHPDYFEKPAQKEEKEENKDVVEEINMQEEYKEEKKEINPPRNEEEYECGACGYRFTTKAKFCPNCGVEFE